MTVKAREKEIVCKVRTQQAENFDEEVKSLVSAWFCLQSSSLSFFWFFGRRLKTEPDKQITHVLTTFPLLLWLSLHRSIIRTRKLSTGGRTTDNQDIAFNIPVDLYDECFYVTGILSFWILLPSCVLFVLSSSISVLSLLLFLLLMGR